VRAIFILVVIFLSSVYTSSSDAALLPVQIRQNHDEVSILTLNTWALPIGHFGSTDKSRHFKLIGELNSGGFDIICLQEVFNVKFREVLSEYIWDGYYTLDDFQCKRRAINLFTMDCRGGLVTLSKYPVLKEMFYEFPIDRKYSIIEKIGKKGFLITTIDMDGRIINIINTHLYSGNNRYAQQRRLEQLAYMSETLDKIEEYHLYPAVFAGDFNIQHPGVVSRQEQYKLREYNYITEDLKFFDTTIEFTEESTTFDMASNYFNISGGIGQKLDYIFFRERDHDLNLKGSQVVFTHERSVSDHNGYKIRFSLSDNTAITRR
jgi:endonuclease/exonuclease/phosphatase family metal-dependent hydrolase